MRTIPNEDDQRNVLIEKTSNATISRSSDRISNFCIFRIQNAIIFKNESFSPISESAMAIKTAAWLHLHACNSICTRNYDCVNVIWDWKKDESNCNRVECACASNMHNAQWKPIDIDNKHQLRRFQALNSIGEQCEMHTRSTMTS